jgi:hypothetical protein
MPIVGPRIQATKPCSVPASGATTCPRTTCAPEKSAIVRAAPAATTRTPTPGLLPIGLSEDCGVQIASRRSRDSGSLCFRCLRKHTAIAAHAVGGPRWYSHGQELKRAAGRPTPRSHALAHPPSLNACGGLVCLIGFGLCLQGIGLVAGMLSPLTAIRDISFKEKGGGWSCACWAACLPSA